MSKNIVIFSDGTGQEGGVEHNTNVYDLFNMIEDRTRRQISFYDRGLGTGAGKFGSISGLGITRNIRECYQFVSDNYSAGDQIFLFGFSRGATTVRTLSAFIHLFGILPRSRPELIARAWKIYKIGNQDKRRRRASEFLHRNHTMWAKVRFLGVWDTVAALGLPIKSVNWLIDAIPMLRHSFHDLRLAKSVQYARHALAVDDERSVFSPKLWDERAERSKSRKGSDPEFFSLEDIEDVYLVAQKLKSASHPVARRLHLSEKTKKLLQQFDPLGARNEQRERVDELRRALVREFNRAVFDADRALYDRQYADEYEGIALSPSTRERIASSRRSGRSSVRWLNRLLIQDAFAVRPARIPRVKQVWFPGMHTDVGGGYPDNDLAHVALMWMLREAMDLGLLVYPKHHVHLHPNPTGNMHNSRAGLGRLYRRRQRNWDREQNQGRSPLVHESVVVRSRMEEPHYDPWILKTAHELEHWPERLARSIQFDDHHVWRESFWGWNNAFAVPWSDVERITGTGDELQGTITIHLRDPGRPDLVIRGSLPRNLTQLVTELERQREHDRLEQEDRRLRSQDETMQALIKTLEEKVARLEEHIEADDQRTARLRRGKDQSEARDQALEAQDREFQRQIEELKAEIEKLKQSASIDSAEAGEDGSELVEH